MASIPQFDAPVSLGNPWRRDRRFFTGLAVTAAALAFVGFAPTYFLKGWFGTAALPRVVHLHGLLMTSWFVLLIVQTSLVAARRTALHRRFGVVGAVLAVVIVVMTVVMVIIGVRVPRGVFAIDATFALVSLGSVAQFAAFVGAALVCRRKPDAHKRLMFIATAVLLTASVGRWPIIRVLGGSSAIVALAVCAVSDLLVVAMIYSRPGYAPPRSRFVGLGWVRPRRRAVSCKRRPATPMRDVRSWAGCRADCRARRGLCSPTCVKLSRGSRRFRPAASWAFEPQSTEKRKRLPAKRQKPAFQKITDNARDLYLRR